MAMLFPANPNTIEAAYKKVMMNLLVELDLSARSLLSIERKKLYMLKDLMLTVNKSIRIVYALDILSDSHAQ